MFAQSLWGGGSAFERAISALNPLAWYRFRDTDFSSIIEDSSGNNYDLTKQIAAATRSSVPTRTTHPGGAYFPVVTYDNWATMGTFYKGITGLLNASAEYTMVVSCRIIASASATGQKVFGVGTEGVAATGTNDLVMFSEPSTIADGMGQFRKRHGGGDAFLTTDITGIIEDGVNRLYIVRFDDSTIFRLSSSKPGHEYLIEDTGATSVALDALSKALVLNARTDGSAGSATTTGMVIDQIALFDTDIGATAETNLHSLWMAEVANAGYYPAMMQFDGSTGYYSKSGVTTSGNKFTVIGSFACLPKAGISARWLGVAHGGTLDSRRFNIQIGDSSNATYPEGLAIVAKNAAGTNLLFVHSGSAVTDGSVHTFMLSFDADAGTQQFCLDGVTSGHTIATLTTGTLNSGSETFEFCNGTLNAGTYFDNKAGFFGYRDAYLTNWSDFMEADGTPKAIDESGWTEWDGRSAGDIGMTEFDGSTGYYSDTSLAVSGNKFTCVIRVEAAPHAGSGETRLFVIQDSSNRVRCSLDIGDSSHADSNYQDRLRFAVQNSAGTNICRLFSNVDLADSQTHMILVDFDGDTGTGNLYVDEISAINAGATNHNAPTTGTLPTASPSCYIGASGTPANYFNGYLGYIWYRDTDGLSVADFMNGSTPNVNIDDVNWTQFGGVQPQYGSRTGEMTDNKGSAGAMTASGTIKPPRPLFWSHTGEMTNNKGSAGDMTKNGTITMTEGGSP